MNIEQDLAYEYRTVTVFGYALWEMKRFLRAAGWTIFAETLVLGGAFAQVEMRCRRQR